MSRWKQIHAPVFSGPCNFFLWSYIKKQVFALCLTVDSDALKLSITAAIEIINRNISESVWDELEKRLDIVRSQLELTFSILRY